MASCASKFVNLVWLSVWAQAGASGRREFARYSAVSPWFLSFLPADRCSTYCCCELQMQSFNLEDSQPLRIIEVLVACSMALCTVSLAMARAVVSSSTQRTRCYCHHCPRRSITLTFFDSLFVLFRPEVDYEAFTHNRHPCNVRIAAAQSIIQIYLAYDSGKRSHVLRWTRVNRRI